VSVKAVVPRARASRDIDAAVEYHLGEAGETVALGFIDALQRAFRHIARHPESGSPRYAHELGLPGLRAWPLKRFPDLVFYVEREDHLDVWRVLHGERDVPAWMRAPGTE
jgi:toxin ParE1/3/4